MEMAHNGFTRESIHRTAAGHGECAWCGQWRDRLYTYQVVADDRLRPVLRQRNAKRFCNRSCERAYNE